MRTVVAMLLSISMLFVGVTAISESAQQAEDTAMQTNASADAWNLSTEVFGGIGQAGVGIVWFGIAAVVLVALGFLVYAGASGGR